MATYSHPPQDAPVQHPPTDNLEPTVLFNEQPYLNLGAIDFEALAVLFGQAPTGAGNADALVVPVRVPVLPNKAALRSLGSSLLANPRVVRSSLCARMYLL